MNLNCVGFYIIKSSSSFRKETLKNEWIHANISINPEFDRYILEVKHISVEDDIYDEDEDDKGFKTIKKIKLHDFKCCEPRGCQRYKDLIMHVLILIPKLFSKAKKLFIGFLNEETQISWYRNLDMILTHKFQNNSLSNIIPDPISTSSAEQFMIDNDVYEGSNSTVDIIATVVENEKSKEIGIKGQYVLVVTDTGMELREESVYDTVKFWEMKNIRKFGEKDNTFFLELGKHCEEGPGVLCFKITQMKTFWNQLIQCKNNCLKNKQNRTSILKKNENPPLSTENSSTSEEGNRDSFMMTMVGNLTYNSIELRFSGIEEYTPKILEPPAIAHPSIPQTSNNDNIDQ